VTAGLRILVQKDEQHGCDLTGIFQSSLCERQCPSQNRSLDIPRRTFSPEQINAKLRLIEVLIGQGQAVAQAVRVASISEQGYYRWRKEYDGLRLEQANASRTWLRSCPWTRQCSKR